MTSLGQELRREREQRAVSLKEFSDRTKISLRILEALEKGDPRFLPEPFFVKSVLRTYARDFGLAEDHFYALYRQETSPEIGMEAAPARPAPMPPAGKHGEKPRRRLAAPALGLAGLILLAAAAAAYVFFVKAQRVPAPVLPAPRVEAPALPAVPSSEFPPVVEAGAIPDGADLRLELKFTADTWIHVTSDGAVQLDGIRRAGEQATCAAKKEFLLQTGNAGGFTLSLNGRALKALGPSGAVLTDVRINRKLIIAPEAASDRKPEKKGGL
jgi:cytoskeleton protein RodZ